MIIESYHSILSLKINKKFFIICLLIAELTLNAQDDSIDLFSPILQSDNHWSTLTEKAEIYLDMERALRPLNRVQSSAYFDSAYFLVDKIADASDRVELLKKLTAIKINNGEFDGTEAMVLDLLNEARLAEDGLGEAEALFRLGVIYRNLGQQEESKHLFQDALLLFRDRGDTLGVINVSSQIGIIYQAEKNYKLASEYLFETLRLSELSKDSVRIGLSLINIGNVHDEIGDFEKSIKFYERSLVFNEQSGIEQLTANSLLNIGVTHYKMNDNQNARLYLSQALTIAEEIGNQAMIIKCLVNLGDVYSATENYSEAEVNYERALFLIDEIKLYRWRPTAQLGLGLIYCYRNDLDLAKKYILASIDASSEIGDHSNYLAFEALAEIESKQGNYQAAFEYYKYYKKISDSIISEKSLNEIWQIEIDYKLMAQRDSLEYASENERLMLHQRIEIQQYAQIATLLGIFILLIIIFSLSRCYESKKRSNVKLNHLNHEIATQNESLETLSELKSRFFTNISHDLRTPLTLITAPLDELLSNEHLSVSEIRENMSFMQHSTRKLHTLIDDIMDLSKLDANEIVINNDRLDVQALIRSIITEFNAYATGIGVSIFSIFDGLPDTSLILDGRKLEKIITNLVSNALKHTPAGGTVKVDAEQLNDQLVISVSDTGYGIDEEDLPHIFERYYQGEKHGSHAHSGSGIGLSFAKEYTLLMGGELEVESEVGRGSVFTVCLPYIVAENYDLLDTFALKEKYALAEEIDTDHDATISNREIHLLLVEDDAELQRFMINLLTQKYRVSNVSNGREALDLLRAKHFDLIISDIMMPQMDGFELLQQIRSDYKLKRIPVIMLTALGNQEFKLRAVELGVDDYLLKPFTSKQLFTHINNIFIRYEIRSKMLHEHSTDELWSDEQNNSFVKQVESVIQLELENEEFNMNLLAEKFNLSERHFRRTIKRITGLSPKEFQQEVALKNGRELLEQKVFNNLSAVAWASGIRNTTRFTKMYIERFGKDPRDFFNTPYNNRSKS